MKKPEITKGKWSLILEGSKPRIGVRNGQIIIPVINNVPFSTKEQINNAEAMTATPNLITEGVKLLEKAESFDEFCAIAENEIEGFKKALTKAGVEL